jgi:transcriptional regulator with XRE-family HTH domain
MIVVMENTPWTDRTTARIGSAVAEQRRRQRMSAHQLSERTRELGLHVHRVAIAKIESGHRKGLDINELIVLAEALDVSPLSLLYPHLLDVPVEYLPGQDMSNADAILRFSGHPSSGTRDATSTALFWDYINAGDPDSRMAKQALDFGVRHHDWQVND